MTHDTLKFLYSFQQSTLTVLPGHRTPSHYVWKRYSKHTPAWKPCANLVHVGARLWHLRWHLVFHPQAVTKSLPTLDKVCQPCDTSMDDGVNPFRLCWAMLTSAKTDCSATHQFIVYLLFAPLEALMRCFFCVAKMTDWYRMFVKQVMWVPSTSSISFLNLLRPLFSWLFFFSFFATHSASAIWCVSQNGRFHGWHGSESHRCPQSMVLCNVKLGWMWDTFPLDICKKGYYCWSSKSETNSQGACGFLAQVEILVFVIFLGSILDICWLVQHWVSLVVQWVCWQFSDVSMFAISIDQRTSDMKKVPCLLNGSV